MEIHDGMGAKKSTVGGRSIMGTKDSRQHYIYVPTIPLKSILYTLSLYLLSGISRRKQEFSEMEHVGDLEDQTSISINENEVPLPDPEDDSFASSVFDEFEVFKRNRLTVIEGGNKCYKVINGCVAQGVGKDTNVAAIHKIPWSGPNGRLEAFRISSAEMVKKCGGIGNVKHAWYGGSRDEICEIISHGFRRCRQSYTNGEDGYGVYLYPLEFVMDGLVSSIQDENGLRHLLLCNVILGNMEEVRPASKQFKPSSNEFDSGVDDLSKPSRIVIWEAYMNFRIFPSYVVSFRAHNVRGFERDRTIVYKPTTPCVGFSVLIPKLANVLPPSKMALLRKYQSEFRRKKISGAQLIHRLRQLAGDELLNDVIKTRESDVIGIGSNKLVLLSTLKLIKGIGLSMLDLLSTLKLIKGFWLLF
ncbi:probable inactive poly [ADP-ribose] polymerase SRO2 [Rhododendron vialii]|uniref:probable inactive poly [ADP-ribose] polymerase SRO2 n=1 Tax=Rhododendron vialii TaxID=182163 RepID=UPI00265F6102|nr:probable inactive poly [ADP-ribose] polymerase SRO2 [Rhododendron vialii]